MTLKKYPFENIVGKGENAGGQKEFADHKMNGNEKLKFEWEG